MTNELASSANEQAFFVLGPPDYQHHDERENKAP
jgi:hypothetical protein